MKVSSENFQRTLHDVLFDFHSVFAVADDVIVIDRGVTTKDALTDHDMNLHKLYERCLEQHIMLNDDKAEMCTTEISFMGHRITKEGIQADPAKITAICAMPLPPDVGKVWDLSDKFYLILFLSNWLDDFKRFLV